ncbi:MAG TPA: UDP-N-acetylmuramoyl-tripeptide--D-alanyl-D-alanine ligase, partial [Candidatus Limnocylindria bacterium]|nr:UDP-N-acetylmuramoyl-tripeptide--D-alanyl-D-alanine ligase [Candidatus Limnocylindria bacterium]
YYQLSSYQAGGYLRALRRQARKVFWPGVALFAASVIFLYVGSLALRLHPLVSLPISLLCAAAVLLCGYAAGFLSYRERKAKTRLVFTPRIRRLYAALLAVGLLAGAALGALVPRAGMTSVLPLLLPFWVLLAAWLAWPLEKAIQLLYRLDARRILDRYREGGLTVIGITGSYGKTSVKNALGAMLSQKGPACVTPASFNTPMGLARCIREDLGPQHRFFVAEMGARHPQDIRVLGRFIRPQAGILTAIGPQHLETMGTIEQIGKTKYDLIRALPHDGFAVFSHDGALVSEYHEKTAVPKALVGIPGSAAWAEDVELGRDGSRFTLCLPDGGRAFVQTRLAGEHSVRNILMAAVMAMRFGVTLEQVRRAAEGLYPLPSRLQASRHAGGWTAINNGFNSNPDSSRKALEVLRGYPGRRIVVTPGFIEQGRQEEEANRRLGSDIAAVADLALLVGEKRTRPILQGLLEGGMPEENVRMFASLADANAFVAQNCGEGDTVLYENDLPDHYS